MASMTPLMDATIEGMLNRVVGGFTQRYEPVYRPDVVERVEYQHVSGFIPFTDGGFQALIIYPMSADTSHTPKVLQDFVSMVQGMCEHDFYEDQIGEKGTDEEVRAYMDKLLDHERGEEADREEYYTWENEYMLQTEGPGLYINVWYYAGTNSRHPAQYSNDEGFNQDVVWVSVSSNTDVLYYRDKYNQNLGSKLVIVEHLDPKDVPQAIEQALTDILAAL